MKLNVPFYEQTTPTNCAPAALRMALAYFGKNCEMSHCEKALGFEEGKALPVLVIGTEFAKMGHKVKFFGKDLTGTESHMDLEYYKTHAPNNFEGKVEMWIAEAKHFGVKLKEKSFSLNEFLDLLSEDSLVTCLLDWNVVRGKEGYQGHIVPVVGHDEANVYVHNPGKVGTMAYFPIARDVFEKARTAKGTDEDFVVIYRKEK
jgi:hypothetical protein